MRKVVLPESIWDVGADYLPWLSVPVRVDWPELQLTDEQIVANALALAHGQERPHPDPAVFTVVVPIPDRRKP